MRNFHALTWEQALCVVGVEPSTPAEMAGLRESDFLMAFFDQPMASSDDLFWLFMQEKIGAFQYVTILRNQQKLELRITLVESEARRARVVAAQC